ncbi:hypothetical protein [Cupriavidus sp. WS]|uniref:hypothetical protein n=1 Tax=Cupriavidus sp. WS TaxID=1312922 RepID=UPI000378C1FC|nr:hypothetical protein [Cupriavidus sp. WS]
MPEVNADSEWKQDTAYSWSHPSGWTIARYVVNGVSRYMLWKGRESQALLDTLEDAQRQHAVSATE